MENYNELYHWGIKGQKWGVRRYQNKDGTLTPAGKKRARGEMSSDAKQASDLKKKSVSELSNAELKKINERTRLEQEYDRLHPSTIKRGWKYVAASAGIMGTMLAVYNNSNQLINIGNKAVNAMLKK
jgi:hypothetical protein